MKRFLLVATGAALLYLALLARTPAVAERRSRNAERHASITRGIGCESCHSTDGWALAGNGGGFDHDRTGFPLRGEHRRVGCTDCHNGERETRRACAACHADIHRGRLGSGCDTCHSSRSFTEIDPVALHRRTRLPLDGVHVLLDCTECHRRAGESIFEGEPSQCFGCHADDYRDPSIHPSHVGENGEAPLSRDCRICHRTDSFTPAYYPQDLIAGSGAALSSHAMSFPLRGTHRTAECADCHTALPSSPRDVLCSGCHAASDLVRQHPGQPEAVSSSGRTCLTCHQGGRR